MAAFSLTPRRILFLAPHPFFQERGTPIAERAVLERLAERGHQVDVLTFPEGEAVEIPGCRILRVPRLPGIRGVRPGFSLKKLAYDALLLAACLRRAHRDRYDLVYAVEEASFIAWALSRLRGLPYVYDMDSSLAEQMVERFEALGRVQRPLERAEALALGGSLGIVAVCRALEERARAVAPHAVIARIEDVSLLDASVRGTERLAETTGRPGPIVLYVGNLEPYQGIDLLLEGFARTAAQHAEAQLVVIGGPEPARRDYERRAAALGLADRAHFVGPRPPALLGWYLEQATILVSPRVTGRNTPMKVYSYLDSGRPLLATDLPTHTQVLDPEIALLVPPTPERLGQGLLRLLTDATLCGRLAERARQRVQREFTPAVAARRFHAFFAQIEARIASGAPVATSVPRGGRRPAPHTIPEPRVR